MKSISVPVELLEDMLNPCADFATHERLRAILDNPVVESEFEPDAVCTESDGCPTEGAVLKRFWRENQPDPVLCEFYEAEDFPSLVRELVGHVAQLQEAAKRNVKPWEDTFPPTLLPAYIARINAEQPAPVAHESECTSCDGSGEYTDAIGDWRGYCTCPAGVEAEGIKGLMP